MAGLIPPPWEALPGHTVGTMTVSWAARNTSIQTTPTPSQTEPSTRLICSLSYFLNVTREAVLVTPQTPVDTGLMRPLPLLQSFTVRTEQKRQRGALRC